MDFRKRMKWFLMFGLYLWGFALTGCHTVEGIGRDIEAAGDAIEDAADED